jgi:thymidine kinase
MYQSLCLPNTAGYLEIILGPMFSGKTSRLIEIYKQCTFCELPVAVINYSLDTRYDPLLLCSHDQIKIPCIQTKQLMDLLSTSNKQMLDKTRVILINEGQFFDDLLDFVVLMLEKQKQIFICGLDGDFERKKFGSILDLIPLCDKVTKLSSLCSLCKNGNSGIFSLRITSEKEQTLIGSDNYLPVCRACYQKTQNVLENK